MSWNSDYEEEPSLLLDVVNVSGLFIISVFFMVLVLKHMPIR